MSATIRDAASRESVGPESARSIYSIRPATEPERERVAASWRTMLTERLPNKKADADPDMGVRAVGLGGVDIARGWLSSLLTTGIEIALFGHQDAPGCTVLVADHPDAPGMPLGWLAFDGARIFALHVEYGSRGSWVGRMLLRHRLAQLDAGDLANLTCTVMTDAGRRLLEHVLRDLRGEVAA